MAILDLQGLQAPSQVRAGKSGASKDCGNVINTGGGHGHSGLSLLLC
ncbi:MAG TPA: SapB/AmfS family lanthipeptide [Solirubrobacteraceae bacterium]|jgi:hypothetical protein|nr:SapB/AmfS family lanthipeptide [Solirubrobacteraceae bacterium]